MQQSPNNEPSPNNTVNSEQGNQTPVKADTTLEDTAPRPALPKDRPFSPHYFHQTALFVGKQSPRIYITPTAYRKMLLYVELAKLEVGWLGTASKLKGGNFLIEDTFLLHQEVSAAQTELSVEGQSKLAEELLLKGEEGLETINSMRFWGHSHVRMGTSPSGTDDQTMLRFRDDGLEWYIRGIFNKLGRAEFTVYYFDLGFAVKDVPWDVYDPESNTIITPKPLVERGGSLFGSWHERTQARDFCTLAEVSEPHPLLKPSDELRASVEAEFNEKVEEHVPFFNFLGLGSEPGSDGQAKGRQEGLFWNYRHPSNYPDNEEYYRNYSDERGRDYHGDPRYHDEKHQGFPQQPKTRGWLWRLIFGDPAGKKAKADKPVKTEKEKKDNKHH